MWKLNDCIPHDNTSENKAVTPTSLYESVLNERGTISEDFIGQEQEEMIPNY